MYKSFVLIKFNYKYMTVYLLSSKERVVKQVLLFVVVVHQFTYQICFS